jgi:hypothetical protein
MGLVHAMRSNGPLPQVIYLSQNLYQNLRMFLDLAQIHSQNTFWRLIMMILGGKRKSDNWITR